MSKEPLWVEVHNVRFKVKIEPANYDGVTPPEPHMTVTETECTDKQAIAFIVMLAEDGDFNLRDELWEKVREQILV